MVVAAISYDVHVFQFDASHERLAPNSGYYDRTTVFEKIHHQTGAGGSQVCLPAFLVLYVNNGDKKCPSHWTRITYEWMKIPDLEAKVLLTHAVSYSSRHYAFSNKPWPPDPGE